MSLFNEEPTPTVWKPGGNVKKGTGILEMYPDPTKADGPPRRRKEGPGRPAAHESRDVTMKHAAFAILREAGAGPSQAAKVLGLAASTGSNLEKKLNAYELKRDKLISKSVQTLEKFVQGKPVGVEVTIDPQTGMKIEKGGVQPKGSDVMRAVEMVMDREQPKINLHATAHVEFQPVDLSDYE